ncbi:ATP-binding cassette domain-containing protein [Brevibacterium sp. 50QC2O2]|uniref:ATP-binding cassette domain-containing protein n=1 Tax=Brevibacterium sp. 50QC2O2 TaxID=2968459 RepID=UPI00211C7392|nr:ATP-binding cassette domain-containing protein [Brevibacterium sp. 50QC2O2]MCQ9387166.1 ATP-binding cassette domain-containing protein [Brevibacterium sp. 50QC2O2]
MPTHHSHTPAKPSITLVDLSFDWPDGTPALTGLSGTFTPGRTGLVGRNGSGKSTLLRLIAGLLQPTGGHIDTVGEVGYLPQTLTLEATTTIADLLGVAGTVAALRAIEAGDVAQEHFDAVGDDWDIEARAAAALERIGLPGIELDRRVVELSGGEAMLTAVTGLRLRGTPITLLDEPTNNLDRAARARLSGLIDDWPGTLVVVSHDLELLERMDVTAELHDGRLETFGGPYSAWRAHLENEQAAAEQAARTADQALKVEKRQQIESQTKLARRERTGRRAQREGGLPKIVAGTLARKAQNSAAGLRAVHEDKVRSAQAAVDAADARVREDEHIRLDLPDPAVPRSRRLLELTDGVTEVVLQGPERLALVGGNGTGKSTLVARLLAGTAADPAQGEAAGASAGGIGRRGGEAPSRPGGRLLTERVGYLPQRLDGLDDEASAMDNVRAVAPDLPAGEVRNRLARLLLRGDTVDRPVSTLSGGERFRVCIARLLLADPPAQLLILDEPTNNLDIASVEQLAEALDAYRGALLVISHDHPFLRRIGIDAVVELDAVGRLHRRAELPD